MSGAALKEVYGLKYFKYSSHFWILNFLESAPSPLRILDVGSAEGYLGAILKERGHYVVGVECDPSRTIKAGAHYDRFHLADVETFDFPYRDQFDFILFADVLEHLRDPVAVLVRALPSLKKSGEIIISVPNIANFVVRIGLLFGRFEYSDRGILDKTHLRFFTLRNLRRMLSDSGCTIVQTRVTPIPVQLLLPATHLKLFTPLHELHYLMVRLWKTLFAYQFVVRAMRKSSH